MTRIVLLYPPPWKIPEFGATADPVDGPPPEYREGDLDPDFWQVPYGLLSLAAQARRAGYPTKILNLSSFTWAQVEALISELEGDLWAMSCWTANRRGVALTAELIKRHHPDAHVLVGGPHATPFPREMLSHHAAIDTVSVGESEGQFLELAQRLQDREPVTGIRGTWYRVEGEPTAAGARPNIDDLDTLASPHDYYATHIVMTSRGCPWACTFCGAESSWGRGFRGQSVQYVLDALGSALERVPVRMLQIKDDTFTTNKKRVLELCRGIRERKLDFLWSCDTRVDVLSEELLREMRLAGCQRLSLGVESGAPAILRAVDKKITVEKIIESTELAKKYGVQVRYYMMLGNRGETAETFQQTLDFLQRAKPHQYIFSCLSIYPGTRDFRDAEAAGWLDREVFFKEPFQELKVPFDADAELAEAMSTWFAKNCGLRDLYQQSSDDAAAVLALLPEHAPAHLDMAGACYHEGNLELAEKHAELALEHGLATPGLAYNYLACIAADRRDLSALQQHLRAALRTDPQHFVVAQNAETLRVWFSRGGPIQNLPLHLTARHEFQVFGRMQQPALPGPLGDDVTSWDAELAQSEAALAALEGAASSTSSSQPRTRLKVVSSP